MGKLVIDGNKVYTVDEACMRRKKLTLEQIRALESGRWTNEQEEDNNRNYKRDGLPRGIRKNYYK